MLLLIRSLCGFLSLICFLSLVSAAPSLYDRDVNVSPPNLNSSSNSVFENLVTTRMQELQKSWPGILLWNIEAKTRMGPTIRLDKLDFITIKAYDARRSWIVTTQNDRLTRDGKWTWNTPVITPRTTEQISPWQWGSQPYSATYAFSVFEQHWQAPFLKMNMTQFVNGPRWGPPQIYYGFWPDENILNAWFVGATDGKGYQAFSSVESNSTRISLPQSSDYATS